MADYVISTDSTADLTVEYMEEKGIVTQNLGFAFGDEVYKGVLDMEPRVFYQRVADGDVAKTNACIPGDVKASFESILKEGKDILHIGFSSGLSASYNVAKMVAEELSDEYPDRKIVVIDSLCAAPGQGLLVYYAVLKKEAGATLEENAEYLEGLKLNVCHEFTVDDLKYLARGGRISKATAAIGTIINIKPVLYVDNEGHLINGSKVRGRKASLKALVDNMGTHLTDEFKNEVCFIGHADCLDDAEYVAKMVKERFGIQKFVINYLCPTIGAHTGPGCVALFYLGKERTPVSQK